MLPQIDNQINNETKIIELPSKTYKLNINNTDKYINIEDYREVECDSRIVLDNINQGLFKNFEVQGNTVIDQNDNILGVRTIRFRVINAKYPSEYQIFVFTSIYDMYRKDDIYDYLSDDGIVLRLEKVDNELVIRDTPLIIPYSDSLKIAYNNLKNLYSYKERNYNRTKNLYRSCSTISKIWI